MCDSHDVVVGVVEQRHAAVLEVLRDGAAVKDVALRFGVTRQTVHGGSGGMRREVWRGWWISRSQGWSTCPRAPDYLTGPENAASPW